MHDRWDKGQEQGFDLADTDSRVIGNLNAMSGGPVDVSTHVLTSVSLSLIPEHLRSVFHYASHGLRLVRECSTRPPLEGISASTCRFM